MSHFIKVNSLHDFFDNSFRINMSIQPFASFFFFQRAEKSSI